MTDNGSTPQVEHIAAAMKPSLVDLVAKWRTDDWLGRGEERVRNECADELEAILTPLVQELGAEIMKQSESHRMHTFKFGDLLQHRYASNIVIVFLRYDDERLGAIWCANEDNLVVSRYNAINWKLRVNLMNRVKEPSAATPCDFEHLKYNGFKLCTNPCQQCANVAWHITVQTLRPGNTAQENARIVIHFDE
jgi:hypothetical protein